MSKAARCKRIHTVSFHIYQVQEQAELIYREKNPNSSCSRDEYRGELTWTGSRGHSEVAEMFFLDGICVTNVTLLKLHLMVYLTCVYFTLSIFYFKKILSTNSKLWFMV